MMSRIFSTGMWLVYAGFEHNFVYFFPLLQMGKWFGKINTFKKFLAYYSGILYFLLVRFNTPYFVYIFTSSWLNSVVPSGEARVRISALRLLFLILRHVLIFAPVFKEFATECPAQLERSLCGMGFGPCIL